MIFRIGCSVRNFATRYVVTGCGLVSARLSGLCEYSNRTSGYVFVALKSTRPNTRGTRRRRSFFLCFLCFFVA
jgi:hypothetical protein